MSRLLIAALLLFVLDQIFKTYLPTVFNAYYVNDAIYTVIMVPFLVSFVLFMYTKRAYFITKTRYLIAIGLVVGGGLSNIFDVVARHGVIDYISFFGISYYNIADAAVLVGLSILSLRIFRVYDR